jgi:tryptophan-rich sensory protein
MSQAIQYSEKPGGPRWLVLAFWVAVVAAVALIDSWVTYQRFRRGMPGLRRAVRVTAATIVAFWRIDRMAGLLLAPYLAWMSYATALNTAIVLLNP